MQTHWVTNPGRYYSIAMLTAVSALLYYMKDGNEALGWILYNRAGPSWPVMWLIDKSVDGTVGQDQNCDLYQTPQCVFI